MPRFLNPTNEALNDLIAPKRKVFKNMVKTFVDEKFPNLGTTEEIEKSYDALSTTLTDLYTSLAEVTNLFIYTGSRQNILRTNKTRAITEYFSQIKKNTNKLELLINRYKTFNFLIPDQIEILNSLLSSIVQKYGELKTAPTFAGDNTIQTSFFQNELAGIQNLDLTLQKVQGLLGSYRQVPAGSTTQFAISALPIAPATQYGVRADGAGMLGGSILPNYSRIDAPFYPKSDGYTINTIAYSQPSRFY
jgi:hypothetical protein